MSKTLQMQAASDGSKRYRFLTGSQLSIVVRIGERELLLQVDSNGNYTLNALIGNKVFDLDSGNLTRVSK